MSINVKRINVSGEYTQNERQIKAISCIKNHVKKHYSSPFESGQEINSRAASVIGTVQETDNRLEEEKQKLSLKMQRHFGKKENYQSNPESGDHPQKHQLATKINVVKKPLKGSIISNCIPTTQFSSNTSYVRLSNSARRPMTLICVRPDIKDFFSNSIPLWNSVTCNTHKFLSPGEFVSLLNHSINRL
ncbi:hypothetical protein CRE_26614 [Caenorhabditis remanei]|uniref:Uncharacterized protein n=1 Tax=Caenorhabditis remanei TaxID=31234 RepID=E3MKV2_CAERE|nr:hypothetical protein CRE_26614 [Caenorhabditis remanei]